MSTDRDLTIEEIRDPARLEAIEVPWNQLLAAHLFQTRGRLLGLPLTVLQSMTNEHSFRFDVLLRDGEVGAPATLVRHLAERGEWDLIQIRDIVWPGSSATRLIDAGRGAGHPTGVWHSNHSPFLAPHGTFEATCETAGSGWKHERGSSIASAPALRAFYTEVAELAGERGWRRLHFLRFGGRAIAFDYSLRYGGRYYCLKIGYEPEFASYSPGQLLKETILERIFAEGYREYDFLGPMEVPPQMSALRYPIAFIQPLPPALLPRPGESYEHRLGVTADRIRDHYLVWNAPGTRCRPLGSDRGMRSSCRSITTEQKWTP